MPQDTQPTPEQIKEWTLHKGDDRRPNILICVGITVFFSTLFVALRVIGRRLGHRRWYLHGSDWLILVSYAFFITSSTFLALMTRYGGGRHIIFITNPKMLQVCSIAGEALYGASMGFLKLSILALYSGLFPDRKFKWTVWVVSAFVFGWMCVAIFGAIFQCYPIKHLWEPQSPGTCIDTGALQLFITICNIVTDFVILTMPMPIVYKLNTSPEKKKLLFFTFAMGGSACVVSIVRLVYSLKLGSLDGSWTAIPAAYVSAIELCVGFFVVSIPTYRPYYKLIVYGTPEYELSSSYNGNYYASRGSRKNRNHSNNTPHNGTQASGHGSRAVHGSHADTRHGNFEMTDQPKKLGDESWLDSDEERLYSRERVFNAEQDPGRASFSGSGQTLH